MSQEETIQIIEELLNSVKTRGFKKTMNVLKTEKHTEVDGLDMFEVFVLDIVTQSFNISLDELLYSRYIRGENKYAIGFVVYYLYDKLTLGSIHKRIFGNKNKTLLSKYRQIIFDLKKSHKADIKYLTIKQDLDMKIENFKKNNQ